MMCLTSMAGNISCTQAAVVWHNKQKIKLIHWCLSAVFHLCICNVRWKRSKKGTPWSSRYIFIETTDSCFVRDHLFCNKTDSYVYRKSGNFHVKIIHVLNIHFNLFLWVYGTHKNILTSTWTFYYHCTVDITHEY